MVKFTVCPCFAKDFRESITALCVEIYIRKNATEFLYLYAFARVCVCMVMVEFVLTSAWKESRPDVGSSANINFGLFIMIIIMIKT